MSGCPYSLAELLPHGPPMVLLDEVLSSDDTSLAAGLTIRLDTRFCQPERGVPAHIGIEWMAQACGAFAGMEARRMAEPVRLGFLLGTRRYHATRSWFAPGEHLVVEVRVVLRELGMAVFDCRIAGAEGTLATAQLTLYRPEDPAAPAEKNEGRP
jgi:predicted hotdog family 3-hydroxylacyl-ACP dehydratase